MKFDLRWWIIAVLMAGVVFNADIRAATPESFPAIVLDDDVTYTISSDGSAEETVHCRIKILNSNGREHGIIEIGESKFERLEKFAGTVTDTTGKLIHKYKEKDGEKYCGFGTFELYRDICTRIFALTTTQYPYIVEYEYTVSSVSVFFSHGWGPQELVPVAHARYLITAPKEFKFSTVLSGAIPQPDILEKGDEKTYVWDLKDIPALKSEECAPPYGAEIISVRISPEQCQLGEFGLNAGSWGTLGKDLYALVQGSLGMSDEQTALADQIRQNSASADDICRTMHKTLSQKTRYVAVYFGIGGWQPHKSAETFSHGYGDCKDLSTLYVSMLRRAGVNATPTLVLTRDVGVIDPAVPSPYFNHMIFFAFSGSDTTWIDPTCPFCDPGCLPWQDENILVLALDSTAGHLVRTPASTPDDNMTIRKTNIHVNEDKSLSVEMSFFLTGKARYSIIGYLMGAEKGDIRRMFTSGVLGLTEAFKIDSFSCPTAGDYPQPLVLKAFGRVQNGVLNVGHKWYVNVEFLSEFNHCEQSDLSTRKHGLAFHYPTAMVDTVVIKVPEYWKTGNLPADTSVADSFGSYSRHYMTSENSLILAQEKKSYIYSVVADQFAEFQKHINTFNAVIAKQIALYEKEP